MKVTPPWASFLAIVVQVAGLGLCVWAMESTLKRGKELSGSRGLDALESRPTAPTGPPMPPAAPPPPAFNAEAPPWSPGAPPSPAA